MNPQNYTQIIPNKVNKIMNFPHFPQILNNNRVKLFKQVC